MPHYIRRGEVPRKRHVQFRQPDGSLYAEEVFGTRGFSGPMSLLYHRHPPTQVAEFEPLGCNRPRESADQSLRHRHWRTARFEPEGDPVTGRRPLLFNEDVCISVCRPAETMDYLYKNADGDDLLYVHEGSGTLETMFGDLPYEPGDYLVIPRGTIYRMAAEPRETRLLVIESPAPFETPRRYRNEWGQLLEHAPFCERDFRLPDLGPPKKADGLVEVRIKARWQLNRYRYPFHPFSLAGWDGCVYPWAFHIRDFEPITGSLHMPPPIHQTFETRNFVVCSFCPRMLDTHPEAIPIPYNHSNLDSDEVLFYCNDHFGSRKGIETGSVTLHPLGLPHGPQPGAVEASLGKTRTEELAVMVDTFRPLRVAEGAQAFEDPDYALSWK